MLRRILVSTDAHEYLEVFFGRRIWPGEEAFAFYVAVHGDCTGFGIQRHVDGLGCAGCHRDVERLALKTRFCD